MYTQTQFTVNQPVLPLVLHPPYYLDAAFLFLVIDVYTLIRRPMPTITSSTRQRLIDGLDSWHFEPHKLPDEDVLACTQLLFEALYRVEGMKESVGVSLGMFCYY